MNILKIVHLLSGVLALLLSFVPSLRGEALPWLHQPDALYLAFIGLANLLIAPLANAARQRLQPLASALLVLAVALQGLAVLLPLDTLAGQPALPLALLGVGAAALLQFMPRPPAAPAQRAATGERPAAPPVRQTAQPGAKPAASGAARGGRETGTVKWFNTSKGFGFISRDSGDDIFVHFRAIRGEGHRVLVEGQRVEFSVAHRDKGLQAEDVQPLD